MMDNGETVASVRRVIASRVRKRLTLCLFLYVTGSSIVTQIYPKVVLENFDGNDSQASKFRGWVTAVSSTVQFLVIPGISGISDAIGRRIIMAAALCLHAASVYTLAATPSSLIAVAACQFVTGLCGVLVPISQAIMIDIVGNDTNKNGEVTHGLGLAGAAFGLSTGVGDILGGSLSELHRRTACLLCAGLSTSALLSLRLFGWDETAPGRRRQDNRQRSGDDPECGAREGNAWSSESPRIANPFRVLKVFRQSRDLSQLALCYFFFVVSLNVFSIVYNYLDYRYHWRPLRISIFFASYNILFAIAAGVGIRCIVPRRLQEEHGAILGLSLQACTSILYGLCTRGWMMFVVLAMAAFQSITEPCLQSIMAVFVTNDRQGSLQGAVMSLRILGEGIAAPLFGQVFALGSSGGFKRAIGTRLPGLPLFLASLVSLMGLWSARQPLRRSHKDRLLSASMNTSTGEREQDNSRDRPQREESQAVVGRGPSHSMNTGALNTTAELLSEAVLQDEQHELKQPLLSRSSAPGWDR